MSKTIPSKQITKSQALNLLISRGAGKGQSVSFGATSPTK